MVTVMDMDIMRKTRIKMQYSETINVESDKK